MASSQPSSHPPSKTSLVIDWDLNFAHGFPKNSNTEPKLKIFRYSYALFYERQSSRDETLGECFQEDFEKFSLQDFKDIDAFQRRNMGTLLRKRGVSESTGNKIRVATALHGILSKLKPWQKNEQTRHPSSLSTATPAAPTPAENPNESSGNRTVTDSNHRNVDQADKNQRSNHSSSTHIRNSSNVNYSLQGLFKAYTDDENKYSNEPTDDLGRKISIFVERYEQQMSFRMSISKGHSQ